MNNYADKFEQLTELRKNCAERVAEIDATITILRNQIVDKEKLVYVLSDLKTNDVYQIKVLDSTIENYSLKFKDEPDVYADKMCHWWGCNLRDILADKRYPNPERRYIVAKALKVYYKLSLAKIAQILGGKDHTTIMASIKNFDKMLAIKDTKFMEQFEKVQHYFTNYLLNQHEKI